MSNELRFDGRVVLITGAGNGLGRSHALAFASRGAKVVVNDLGGSAFGDGKSTNAADTVVAEIKKAGGEAVANYDSVENGDKIVQTAMDTWGRIDVVVNNAGILRDTSFHKMSQGDWDLIYKVHVYGTFKVTHAAWNYMRDHDYGRVINTASAAGIYGNFGQVNYAMAKLGLVGMTNALAIEGKKKGVHVNAIAPIAGSRMTETVLPKELIEALRPEFVSPLVLWLAHESCTETGGLFEVGGGYIGKLRWERTEGKRFKLARPLSPEAVKKEWSTIVDFGKATHPADITQSMQPILDNLGSAKSKGGNEFIDVDEALAAPPIEVKNGYDERDLALYALAVGAAKDPTDQKDLSLVYEASGDGFKALPTFGVVPMLKAVFDLAKQGKQAPGLNYGFDRILHGEQYLELKQPLPATGKLTHKMKVKEIFDKGKHALVVNACTTTDENGNELAYNELTTLVRGAGGWGGDRGPTAEVNVPPDRAPDAVITETTDPNQALLYRLTGDWNPLHVDPNFAKAFGFQRPILHGLCTFGFAGRHVIKQFAKNGDPRYFKSIKARFADSVFPGETLRTEMWKDGDNRVIFRTKVVERDSVVISNAAVEFYPEIPKPAAKKAEAKPAQAGGAAPTGEPTSADVFRGIGLYLEKNPGAAEKANTVFQFKLSGPDSAWTIDARGKGSVKEGTADKPDVTLEMTDADFMAMVTGKADAQKLYFGGKLKIGGNVMASQKLQPLLKGMDPSLVVEAMKQRGASAPAAAAPQAAPSGEITADMIFFAIGHHVQSHPELPGKINTTFQFKLTSPDAAYFVDVKNGKGGVTPGTGDKPDVTLELSTEDFIAMSTGKADPQKLYFGGKLKIGGNVMASQKLMFLKEVDPKAAASAYAEQQAKGGGAKAAAAAPAAKSGPGAKEIFAKAADTLAKNPGLAKEVGAVLQFVVKSPDSSWVVDLKNGATVKEGTDKAATTTFTMDEADLADLAAGKATAQTLYQHGKLRVDGDVRPAHKLAFLKG